VAITAGSAVIGHVITDSGSVTNATLQAGSALVGKVGIDQTTLGSTNNVSLSVSTGAGTSVLVKDDPSFGDGVTTGIASVTGRLYNGTNYDRTRSIGGLSGTTGLLAAGMTDGFGNKTANTPYSRLQVELNAHQIMYDPFDSALNTTNLWSTPTTGNGGVVASNSAGAMTIGTGTTASGWSKLTSQAAFVPTVPGWIGYSFLNLLPDLASPTANAYRFWGAGTIATTPTTTAPMTDAVGFELSTAGKMFAVVYTAGTRTAVQDLSASTGNSTQPTDANLHRYIVKIRTDKTFFYIDGETTAQLVATFTATTAASGPSVQTLPISFLAVGGSTPPVSNSQIQSQGAVVWDASQNNNTLSDGLYQWRKATVKPASTAAAAADTALVVGIHPSSNTVQVASGPTYAQSGLPPSRDITSIGGNDVRTTAPGVMAVSLAGPTGDPLDSTGQALSVALTSSATLAASPTVQGVQSYYNGSVANAQPLATVKLGPSNIYGYHIYNTNSAVVYVQFFNAPSAGSVTLATTIPTFQLVLPASGWVDASPGSIPISFSKGIVIAATASSGGSGNPGTGVIVNLWYA
jgi:hypothetical protein